MRRLEQRSQLARGLAHQLHEHRPERHSHTSRHQEGELLGQDRYLAGRRGQPAQRALTLQNVRAEPSVSSASAPGRLGCPVLCARPVSCAIPHRPRSSEPAVTWDVGHPSPSRRPLRTGQSTPAQDTDRPEPLQHFWRVLQRSLSASTPCMNAVRTYPLRSSARTGRSCKAARTGKVPPGAAARARPARAAAGGEQHGKRGKGGGEADPGAVHPGPVRRPPTSRDLRTGPGHTRRLIPGAVQAPEGKTPDHATAPGLPATSRSVGRQARGPWAVRSVMPRIRLRLRWRWAWPMGWASANRWLADAHCGLRPMASCPSRRRSMPESSRSPG